MSIFYSAPDYTSVIDELFEKIDNEAEFIAKQKEIKEYVEGKKPTTETTESTEGPSTEVEGGKKMTAPRCSSP